MISRWLRDWLLAAMAALTASSVAAFSSLSRGMLGFAPTRYRTYGSAAASSVSSDARNCAAALTAARYESSSTLP
ncbi:hypothetical protein BDZ88DRAFT_422198 [Geranomyces variabilis]|nr:hypothetical protein BDZ88DRAFT_422198 [Geranomyces variabilis]